jgi:GAF domain-containing protein
MSSTPDSTVADPQHVIAELKRELARRTAEGDEALARETATAEVLRVINSAPGDLAPVFDAILEKARTICGVDRGTLQLYDGEYFRAVATHGLPEALVAIAREPYRPAPSELRAQLLAGARFAQAADLAETEGYRAGAPSAKTVVDIGGTRSVLWVPLRKDGVLLGAISAARTEVRPFSNKEIALLENFAAQAVIAIDNARLLTETREALEQQTATAELLGVINSSPGDLTPVFDAMLERALALCGASFGMLNAYDGEQFHAAAVRGVPEPLAEFRRRNTLIFVPGTPPSLIQAGENVVHRPDVMDEASYKDGDPMTRALVELGRARTLLVVALRKDETLLGILSVYRQEVRPFTDKQIALLQNFAAQAVIAIENARLLTETREALEQ